MRIHAIPLELSAANEFVAKQFERESLVDRFRSFPQTRSTTPTTWRTSSKLNGSKNSMKWR